MPPEHLADYIAEFRALLDGHGLSYGMFGHVDAGVLHVRPALDMCDPQQEMLMKRISDDVVALTAKYGGLLWGNTGKASAPNIVRRSLAKRYLASCARLKPPLTRITALTRVKSARLKALTRR